MSKQSNERKAMDGLEKKWDECRKCRIGSWSFQHVFGEGAVPAKFLFIGEGPGVSEDALGQPFIGRSGRLLRQVLRIVGFTEKDFFITNLVACRPCDGPGSTNRAPTYDEVWNCHNRVREIVHLVKPKIIIAVGNVAMEHIEDLSQYWTVKIRHPAYILRQGGMKSEEFNKWYDHIKEIYKAVKSGG